MKIKGLTLMGAILTLVIVLASTILVYGQEPTEPDYAVFTEDISFSPTSPVHVDTSVTISANIHNLGICYVTLDANTDQVAYSFYLEDTDDPATIVNDPEIVDIYIIVRARVDPVGITVWIDDYYSSGEFKVDPGDGWVKKSPFWDRSLLDGGHKLEIILTAGAGPVGDGILDIDYTEIYHENVPKWIYQHAEKYDKDISGGVNGIVASDVVVRFYDGDPAAGGIQIDGDQIVGDQTNYVHDIDDWVQYIKNSGVATASVTWTAYPAGYHDIYVVVGDDGNEANNKALKTIGVYAYLTITVTTGGTTDPPPGKHTYYGGTATVTAYPDPGYVFVRWELDGAYYSTANPTTVDMKVDHTLHAVFSKPVGGIWVPVDKLALLTPYIVLGVALVAITVGAVYARKRWLGKAVVQRP